MQTEAQESLSLAEQWLEGNQPWEAYKVYAGVKERFGGYDLPTDVAAKMKELEADSKVKNEVAANKALEAAAKLLRQQLGLVAAVGGHAAQEAGDGLCQHRSGGRGATVFDEAGGVA